MDINRSLLAECALRPVQTGDEDLILEMRNQDHVRKNMLNSEAISSDNHRKWFQALLKSHDKAYFICLYNHEPAGVIGFYNIEDDRADWSFYLNSENFPKGLGTIMCVLGLNEIFKRDDVSAIQTLVLADNPASLKLHEKLGFRVHSDEELTSIVKLSLDKKTWNNDT